MPEPTPAIALAPPPPTIGVFDSGFGGLTVLRALLDHIPNANYVFLGDSARLPYGSKSQATVARFAVSSARFLLDQGADLLVIACNTASALALPEIQAAAAPTPVIGVIAPGAEAALAATEISVISTQATKDGLVSTEATKERVISTEAKQSGDTCFSTQTSGPTTAATVLVLATTATVASGAYTAALATLGLTAIEKACPLFVPLLEEGWTNHPVTAEVARIYLAEALAAAPHARTLLLGCTHYPLIASLLERTAASLGHPLHLVDSAHATAQAVLAALGPQPASLTVPHRPDLRLFATDSVEKFQRLGSHFLGRPLPPVQLVDLGG